MAIAIGRPEVRASRLPLVGAFAALYFIWGGNFLAVRYAVEAVPPFLLMGARSLIAGIVLYAAGRIAGAPRPTRLGWCRAAFFGLIFFVLGHGMLAYSQKYMASGLAALFLATTPLWVPLIGWLLPGGRAPAGRIMFGLVLGFLGVVILISARALGGTIDLNPVVALIVTFCAFCWGLGSVLSPRLKVADTPTLASGMELILGGSGLLIVAFFTGDYAAADPQLMFQAKPLSGFIYMIVGSSLVGFSCYLFLLSRTTPERVSTYAYVNPLVAITLGSLVAGEPLTPEMLIAGLLILGAVLVVLSRPAMARILDGCKPRSTDKNDAASYGAADKNGRNIYAKTTVYRQSSLVALLLGTAAMPASAGETSIKIGILADLSSFSADIGGQGAILAARMAVQDYGGKADGKPVEILSADVQNKPDVAAGIARSWFDTDKVDAIADIPVSSIALAVQEVAREKKKVLLITAGTTADLTGKACSPYTIHWADDTVALSTGTAKAVTQEGGKTWFFVTADFAFGLAMERDATAVIKANGGEVVGDVKHPVNTGDFSSYLLTAQASKAQVVGFANVGTDMIGAVKQAGEFGLAQGGQRMVGFITFITDVNSLGLDVAHGLVVTSDFYWDTNDQTRAWSKRFFEQMKKMPTKEQANTYVAILHYLKAIDAAKSDDAATVAAKMKEMPGDQFGSPVKIREDGRVLYDLGLYEVKTKADSKYPWDYYKKLRTITAAEAFRPLDQGGCPFVK